MKKLSRFCTLILSVILSLSALTLSACGSYSTAEFRCFNTDAYIAVNKDLTTEVKEKISLCLEEIETSVKTDLLAFNFATKDKAVLVSNDTAFLLTQSKNCFDLTAGKFNPAVKPLLDLWLLSSDTFDKNKTNFAPPSDSQIQALLPSCDFNKVSLSDNSLIKLEDGLKLDFGASIKGYAVDKIKGILVDNGYTGGYINIGGSSIYVLDFKDGLSIKHPRKAGENVIKVKDKIIKNSPLSTSGDYVKFYLDNNGNRYSHFIDANTGKPSTTGFSSVTVIANSTTDNKTAVFTDMISTALMLMQKQELIDFVSNNLSNFTVFAINNEEIITNADKKDFTLIDADYKINFI